MFCYQCEQTMKGTGCTKIGICGKDAETAACLDLLTEWTKALGWYARRARKAGLNLGDLDAFVYESLFTTVTNVNFDPARIAPLVYEARRRLGDIAVKTEKNAKVPLAAPAFSLPPEPAKDIAGLVAQGEALGIEARLSREGADITGLRELIYYGLKGAAAYMHHALVLGTMDAEVADSFFEILAELNEPHSVAELTGLALKTGEVNLKVMALLDHANTGAYGHPTPTAVRITPKAGKAILVSGHDLLDLEALLRQTEGKGINIYTHGEMLPAHGYPELKKYAHLAGNYGGAWQDQREEFDAFPGAILMTTNCIQRPKETYKARIFTSGPVAWPGVTHVSERHFGPVIEAALAAPGFARDEPEKTILVGFGHNAVLSVADKVVDAVKQGQIRRFFLIGGCDGAKSGRNYYTELAQAVPQDCMILTLACGKYRFNKLEFGTVAGLPRLLDIGQCNDSYSAIQIAVALAKVFDTEVNKLPLSIVLSWYEQKAVSVLLSLLHLGITNIRIGPSLPAFVTPPVLDVLVKSFGLTPIGTVEGDLKAMLN